MISREVENQSEDDGLAPKLACGVDIVEVDLIARGVELAGENFLQEVYTDEELAWSQRRTPRLAALLALKEAVSKALGTGVRGVTWHEMEILMDDALRPTVHLTGAASERAQQLGLDQWSADVAQCRGSVIAFVVAIGT